MTIEQAEKELLSAMLAGDVARLDNLLSEDLIFTSHTGAILTKADDLEAHRSGRLKLSQALPSDLHIRAIENGSIVSVRLALKGTFDSVAFSGDFRYTRVWKLENGDWVVVAAHASEIK